MSLRQELEAARQALRLQTARCRQLCARQLQQKDREISTWRSLRDRQLAEVLRALMGLEARLRREQRTIRTQLGERDAVIRAQQQEISRLRKLLDTEAWSEEKTAADEVTELPEGDRNEYDVKPDLISSLGINHLKRHDKSSTPTTTDNEDSQSNMDSLQLSFYELGSQPESLASNLSTQSLDGHERMDSTEHPPPRQTHDINWNDLNTLRGQNVNNISVDQKHPRCTDFNNSVKNLEVKVQLESQYLSQKNILSPVKEESSVILSACNSPARCNPSELQSVKESPVASDITHHEKPSPSTLLQEVRISGRHEYEDNPVLNCVNQILLRDQEEFLEEQRAIRLKEQEKARREAEALNNKKLTKSTENLCLLNEQIIVQHSPVKGKVYPPLDSVSPQLNRRPVNEELDETHYKHAIKGSPLIKLTPSKDENKSKIVPPALPPKPLRLLQTKSKSLDQKTILSSILPQLKSEETNALERIKHQIPLPQPSSDNELYVISNSAIDDELLQQLQGRRLKSCSDLTAVLTKSKPTTQSRESIYVPAMSHPTHKPPIKPASTNTPPKEKSSEQKASPKRSPTKHDDTPKAVHNSSPVKKLTPSSHIKVASPVSSLLNSVEVIEPAEENGKKTSPSVSQIVRKFEVLGTKPGREEEAERTDDNLQKNFEEFRLDECDMDALCGERDDGRLEGDGAETRLVTTTAVVETRVSYENFLEATGLSQKSIMTPSRLFSNHKSVLKPKDVKHRSRVKAAAVVDRCNNNTVRYWTEPFL